MNYSTLKFYLMKIKSANNLSKMVKCLMLLKTTWISMEPYYESITDKEAKLMTP